MRVAPRVLLGVSLTAVSVLGPALPALAVGSGTATVKPTAEAWYRVPLACTLLTGCADLTGAPMYSPGTLHVGVNAGTEEARTYLQLDLASLPSGTKPFGGTLLLPLATATSDGTRAPETAKMQACAVTGEVTDVDGSFQAPPRAECEIASVPATFVPAEGENPAAFTVDLASLTAAWEGSATPGALALLPARETAPPDSWHAAFSRRDRTGQGVVPISAALSFVSAPLDTSSAAPPVVPPPPFEPAPAPAFDSPGATSFDSGGTSFDSGGGTSFAAPPLSVDTPLAQAPAAQSQQAPVIAGPSQQQAVPVASFVPSGFRYPGVFLLPLLLVVGASWIARALTRDLVIGDAVTARP